MEAVEQLADRIGYQISYEGGGPSVQRDRGTRARLVAANAAAQEFYAARLKEPDAQAARDYPHRTQLRRRRGRPIRLRLRPGRVGHAHQASDGEGIRGQGTRGGRPVERGASGPDRPVPPPAAVADPQPRGRCHRLRSAQAVRRRHHARQVRQHPETILYKKSNVLFGLDLAKRISPRGIKRWWWRATPTSWRCTCRGEDRRRLVRHRLR